MLHLPGLGLVKHELRKVFPLGSNRLKLTAISVDKVLTTNLETVRHSEEMAEFEEDRAVTKIEARNVINGLALLEHIKETGNRNYPFGFDTGTGADKLRPASGDEANAINAD